MIREGKLVFVPSQVTLQKYEVASDGTSAVSEWKRFEEPKTFLVSDTKSVRDHVGVFFQNETWYIKEKEVTPVEERSKNEG